MKRVLAVLLSKVKCAVMLHVVVFSLLAMPCIADVANIDRKDHADVKGSVDGKGNAHDGEYVNDPVNLTNGWVRASLPGANNSAAFLTLRNNTALNKTIVAVSCTAAQQCELHQHTHVDGKMRMGKVNNLILPANSELKFTSGGYHVMLIGVLAPLSVGAMVELTFIFEDNTKYSVNLPVKSVRDE